MCALGTSYAAPGEYWESTTKVEMTGMPIAMPERTTRFCMAKGREKDATASVDKSCQVLESNVTGNKTTFKVRCEQNGDVTTGTGEITFSPGRSDGRMAFTSKDGDMKMTFANKRVGGDCDADEQRKKIEAATSQANQAQQQVCEKIDLSAEVVYGPAELFVGKGASCADRKDKFCAAVQRSGSLPLGYQAYKNANFQGIPRACGLSMDSLKKDVCKSINAGNPDSVKRMQNSQLDQNALKADCPAEYKVYAETMRKRYCEGRSFTERQKMSLDDCLAGKGGSAVVTPVVNATDKPADKPAESTTNANPAADLLEGAKKLKNLFGF